MNSYGNGHKSAQVNNPFVYNVPVTPANFAGRERILAFIFDHLQNPNRANIALYGPLGVGKSSLLNYIADPEMVAQWGLDLDKYILCHIDCQSFGEFSPESFWRRVFRGVLRSVDGTLRESVSRLVEKPEISFEDVQDLLDELEQAERVLIVVLDEFECVVRTETELAERTTRHLLGMLSSVGRHTPRVFAMVIATGRSLPTLSEDLAIWRGSPFSTIFVSHQLPPFSPSEAGELFDRALAGTGVIFSDRERWLVYEHTEGYPALLQAAAAALFDARQHGATDKEVQGLVQAVVADIRSSGSAVTARRVWLDDRASDVWVNGSRIMDLSNKEFSLFRFLYNNAGRLCTKDQIWEAVWPECEDGLTDYPIHKMVSRLRYKIEPDPDHPQYILTVWGRGYKFVSN